MLLYKVNCARQLLKPVRTDYHLTLFYPLYKDNLEFIFDFYQNLFYQNGYSNRSKKSICSYFTGNSCRY